MTNNFSGLSARYSATGAHGYSSGDQIVAAMGYQKPTTLRQRVRDHQMRVFFKKMQQAMVSAMLYGGEVKVDKTRLRSKDVYYAEKMGMPLVAEWIQATSAAFKWGHKERKAFMGEWRSYLWDLQNYLSTDLG